MVFCALRVFQVFFRPLGNVLWKCQNSSFGLNTCYWIKMCLLGFLWSVWIKMCLFGFLWSVPVTSSTCFYSEHLYHYIFFYNGECFRVEITPGSYLFLFLVQFPDWRIPLETGWYSWSMGSPGWEASFSICSWMGWFYGAPSGFPVNDPGLE